MFVSEPSQQLQFELPLTCIPINVKKIINIFSFSPYRLHNVWKKIDSIDKNETFTHVCIYN